MTRLLPFLLAVGCSMLSVECFAQPPPLPEATSTVSVAEAGDPVTYPRTVTWEPSVFAQSYVLTVNGSVWMINTNIVTDVPLVEGTNRLTLYAVNTAGQSPTVTTNYLVATLRITGCEVLCSSNLLTWTKTNLPPAQTNPTGYPLMFKLNPTLVVKLEERHGP